MGSLEGLSKEERTSLVFHLRAWQTAKEEAARYNRNLLQYAAGIAALIGIGTGSGGVFAIAGAISGGDGNSSQTVPDWALALLIPAGIIIVAGALVMLGFMIRAFPRRWAEEGKVDKHQEELIGLVPDRFLPKEE